MLKFQWDALRRGDTVFVHDASEDDLGLRAGVVTLVDVRPSGNDLGIAHPGTRPGPSFDPDSSPSTSLPDDHDCWRCSDNRPQRPDIGVTHDPELSRGR